MIDDYDRAAERVRAQWGVGGGSPSGAVVPVPRQRASLAGGQQGYLFPYEAASWDTPEMGDWLPRIGSSDNEINLYRDRMVARTRDLERNDGWVSGAVARILDSTLGAHYRLSAKPDHRALKLYDKAFDANWAEEFSRTVEALFRGYSEDLGRYNDLGRQLSLTQQFRQALGHTLVDGEGIVLSHWREDRIGPGGAKYATTFAVTDPDLLSNPYQMVDSRNMRGGVEIDDDGVPVAFHFRKAHQNDWYNALESMQWERVLREDPDGWMRVHHSFDRKRAGQNRGVSVFAPVVARLKMLARYYGVSLQQSAIAATFGTYITSPYDQVMVQDALETENDQFGWYQGFRQDWNEKRPAMLNNARIPALAPGEDVKSVEGKHPMAEFSPFAHEMLRSVAAVLGVSAEQVTQDYSETNYSSARAGMVEAEKSFKRRVFDFNINIANPLYANWLHEAMEQGLLADVLPKNAPDFMEARNAYARCRWLGPGRGWVDPVADRQGSILGLDAGFSTLDRECVLQGEDWEENLEQRARERNKMDELKLPHPQWMGEAMSSIVDTDKNAAQSTITKPVAARRQARKVAA